MRNLLVTLVTLFVLCGNMIAASAENDFADREEKSQAADIKTDVRLRASVLIRAKPELVKASIHEQRTVYKELEYAKVLSTNGKTTITEQRFDVRMLGMAACTFEETDVSAEQIDYRLVKSDTFAAMDGRWVMTPTADNLSTRLDLYCHAGVFKRVPQFLLKFALSRSLRRHLEAIKKSAENKNSGSSATTAGMRPNWFTIGSGPAESTAPILEMTS